MKTEEKEQKTHSKTIKNIKDKIISVSRTRTSMKFM